MIGRKLGGKFWKAGEDGVEDQWFVLAGEQNGKEVWAEEKEICRGKRPVAALSVLALLVLGCLFCRMFIPKDPSYMDLQNCSVPPGKEFWFGTDAMGRDFFSMIWYGGRISLFIGFASAGISTAIAILFGSASGLAPRWLDGLLMRFAEILLSVPELLLVVLIQAALGSANILTISLCVGITGWETMAKVIRTEVRQLRRSEYVIASKSMGGGFFHILWEHLAPNFIPSIMFMVVMNIRSAIIAESTLSFMGLGLPLDRISWGSILSLSERALLSGSWWMILIPGLFLVLAISCVTEIGNWLRRGESGKESYLSF